MIRAAINNAQGISCFLEIKVNPFHSGVIRIFKVDEHQVANRGSHLIHQPTRLTKVYIFRILSDLCNLNGRHLMIEEQFVQNGSHQNFKGCRRAQTAAGQNVGMNFRIKALKLCTLMGKGRCNTPNQGCRAILFILTDRKIIQLHNDFRIAFGANPDAVGTVQRYFCYGFQIHRGCENAAVLVVGMVAADFRAAGSREHILIHKVTPSLQPTAFHWPFQHAGRQAGNRLLHRGSQASTGTGSSAC